MTAVIGYARVSTGDQSLRMQLDALASAGVAKVHQDTCSGAVPLRARPGGSRLLAELPEGGRLVVWKLDRLARDLADLLSALELLKARGVALVSLTEPIDTGQLAGELLLSIMGALAAFERGLTRERQTAGIAAARVAGVRLGRRAALTGPQIATARSMLDAGYSARHVATVFHVAESTIRRVRAGGGPYRMQSEPTSCPHCGVAPPWHDPECKTVRNVTMGASNVTGAKVKP